MKSDVLLSEGAAEYSKISLAAATSNAATSSVATRRILLRPGLFVICVCEAFDLSFATTMLIQRLPKQDRALGDFVAEAQVRLQRLRVADLRVGRHLGTALLARPIFRCSDQ